jgi:hypothetical protein
MATDINDIILRYIQAVGVEIFKETQRTAPVRSGALKESGSFKYVPNGLVITYNAPHARKFAVGESRSPNETYKVKQHQRRTPNGWNISIKEYERKVGLAGVSGQRLNERNFFRTSVDTVLKNHQRMKKIFTTTISATEAVVL